MKTLSSLTLALAGLLASSGPAVGGDPKQTIAPPVDYAPAESPWRFRLDTYAWLTAADGTIGAGGLTAPVDISISDTLDALDIAFMGAFEIAYDRWSFATDLVYGETSTTEELPGFLFKDVNVQSEQFFGTFALGYDVVSDEACRLTVYAGARLTYVSTDLEFRPGRLAGRTIGADDTWVDPLVGFRVRASLGGDFFIFGDASIGGFGAASDLIWSATGGVGYNVTQNVSLGLGYRGYGYDYEDDQFIFDVDSYGPVVGLEIRF